MHQFKVPSLLCFLLLPPLTLFLFKRSFMEIRRDIQPWDFYQIWSRYAHISLLQLPPFIEIEHIIQLFFSVFKESNCLNIPQIGRCIIFLNESLVSTYPAHAHILIFSFLQKRPGDPIRSISSWWIQISQHHNILAQSFGFKGRFHVKQSKLGMENTITHA